MQAAKWIFLAVIAMPCRANDWPRLLGSDFENTAGPSSANVDFHERPSTDWRLDVGDGYGLGSVAGDVYYQLDAVADRSVRGSAVRRSAVRRNAVRGAAVRGTHQSRLRAIDMKSGDTIWSQSLPAEYRDLYGYENGPRSSPTIADDRIYTMGVDGQLCCRRTSDGELVWTIPTAERYGVVQNFFGVGGSPLVLGENLYAMVGGSPAADQDVAPGQLDRVSPNGTLLMCVDRRDGDVGWLAGDDLASYSSPRPISLGGKAFVLIYGRDHLWCLAAGDGAVAWKYRHRADILETVNAMVPVVIGNQILISECYSEGSVLLEASETSVKEVWRDPSGRRRDQSMRVHWSTPIRDGNFLFGCSGRNAPDSSLRCIDWRTGEVKWESLARKRSSVTKLPNDFIVWTERGEAIVAKLDGDQWQPVTQWEVEGLTYPCWASPIVVGDQGCCCGATGKWFAFDSRSRKLPAMPSGVNQSRPLTV